MLSPARASLLGLAVVALAAAGCPDGAGITCPDGQVLCVGACVHVDSDAANCGGCGRVCAGGLACLAGSCGCPGALVACGNACVDVAVDPQHCGGCSQACPAEHYCVAGACVLGCPTPLTLCPAMTCVDTRVDPNHCGGCGVRCARGDICCASSCVTPNDDAHCGSCEPCPMGEFCMINMCFSG